MAAFPSFGPDHSTYVAVPAASLDSFGIPALPVAVASQLDSFAEPLVDSLVVPFEAAVHSFGKVLAVEGCNFLVGTVQAGFGNDQTFYGIHDGKVYYGIDAHLGILQNFENVISFGN